MTTTENNSVRFITTFSAHHNVLRNILNRHWHILTEDTTLFKHVKSHPELVYRHAHSLRDRLTQSHYLAERPPHSTRKGTFQCGNCPRCPLGTGG